MEKHVLGLVKTARKRIFPYTLSRMINLYEMKVFKMIFSDVFNEKLYFKAAGHINYRFYMDMERCLKFVCLFLCPFRPHSTAI